MIPEKHERRRLTVII